jgi:hypothetical protein
LLAELETELKVQSPEANAVAPVEFQLEAVFPIAAKILEIQPE